MADSDEEEFLRKMANDRGPAVPNPNFPPQRAVPVSKPNSVPIHVVSGYSNTPPSRSPPRRPYVESGKPTSNSNPSAAPKHSSFNKAYDDDDDLDVLSNSSDEEDAVLNKLAKKGSEASSKQTINLRGANDLVKWRGEDNEPDSWKYVNEEELVRSVRKMRNLTFEKQSKASTKEAKKKNLESTETDSSNAPDPLGLGLVNLRSLSLKSRISNTNLDQNVDSDKLLIETEKFDPKFYISNVHKDSTINELETGLQILKSDIEIKKDEIKSLVKDNFECFISCKYTISDLHLRMKKIEKDFEGAGTNKISKTISKIDALTKQAFSPLLERQAQVDRIRSVQGLLQRFRTLFNLPGVIRTCVRNKDYDNAVHEYLKAKSLSLPSHSGILKKVLEEVEKVALEFKNVLFRLLDDPETDSFQVENAIRILLALEPDSDPIWQYFQMQERKVRGLLEGCYLDHEKKMHNLREKLREEEENEVRWRQIQKDTNSFGENESKLPPTLENSNSNSNLNQEFDPDWIGAEEADALHLRLIRRLSSIIKTHIPRLNRLSASIFSGKFAHVNSNENTSFSNPSKSNFKPKLTPSKSFTYEKNLIKYAKHTQEEFTVLILGIIGLYETKIQNAFEILEAAKNFRPHMQDAVMEVANVCTSLKASDLLPVQACQVLQQLRIDLTKKFVYRLCLITRGASAELAGEEDWIPVPKPLRQNSDYAISSFPLRFQDTLTTFFDCVTDVLSQLVDEEGVSNLVQNAYNDTITNAIKAMYDYVKTTFFESFLDFIENLANMSLSLSHADSANNEQNDADMYADKRNAGSEKFSGLMPGIPVSTADKKILMLLSNAGFCRKVVVNSLVHKYSFLWNRTNASAYETVEVGSAEAEKLLVDDLIKHFLDLETSLEDQYISIKITNLGTVVMKYFIEDGTTWSSAPPVKGLRDSALELMFPLVALHAEVYAGCRPFVDKTINILSEGLLDALARVAEQHEVLELLDPNGFCQLSLELDYFETVLNPYASESLKEVIDKLREFLSKRTMIYIQSVGGGEQDREGEKHRRPSRLEDGDSSSSIPKSLEDLKTMAANLSADLLPGEIRRTMINILCFSSTDLLDHFASSDLIPVNPLPPNQVNSSPLNSPSYAHSPILNQPGAYPRVATTPNSASPSPYLSSGGGGGRRRGYEENGSGYGSSRAPSRRYPAEERGAVYPPSTSPSSEYSMGEGYYPAGSRGGSEYGR